MGASCCSRPDDRDRLSDDSSTPTDDREDEKQQVVAPQTPSYNLGPAITIGSRPLSTLIWDPDFIAMDMRSSQNDWEAVSQERMVFRQIWLRIKATTSSLKSEYPHLERDENYGELMDRCQNILFSPSSKRGLLMDFCSQLDYLLSIQEKHMVHSHFAVVKTLLRRLSDDLPAEHLVEETEIGFSEA